MGTKDGKKEEDLRNSCPNLFRCLAGSNLSDDERRRILIFLTEMIAYALKVDAKLST